MRLTSSLWVDALVRRCTTLAVPVYVARRGAAEAGAIFIRLEYDDRTVDLFAPAPQSLVGEETGDRLFERAIIRGDALTVVDYLDRQAKFDADLWIVDIEHRADWPADQIVLAEP